MASNGQHVNLTHKRCPMYPQVLSELVTIDQGAEEFLCKHSNVWSEGDRYFDRCAAGLGIKETEHRLEDVRNGVCKPSGNGPAPWEQRQLDQFGDTQQLSCNPASLTTGFTVANGQCPLAYRAHFPCVAGTLDFQFCTGENGGADVKKDGMCTEPTVMRRALATPRRRLRTFHRLSAAFRVHSLRQLARFHRPLAGHIVPYHELCMGHDLFRRVFECVDPKPPREGANLVQYALEWYKEHGNLGEPPATVVNWEMGTPIGVWGGTCYCPDGRVYQVGDEGNMCGSVACDGGVQGECHEGEGGWSFRKVTCAPLRKRPANANEVIDDAPGVGVWGGTCTCPDGQVYLVGDENNACGSMACEGGVAGLCNNYVSLWAHRRVRCYTGPQPPPLPPTPPPLPPIVPPAPPPSVPSPPFPPGTVIGVQPPFAPGTVIISGRAITSAPTAAPTVTPTDGPTATPTVAPTVSLTVAPTATPTAAPTTTATTAPTATAAVAAAAASTSTAASLSSASSVVETVAETAKTVAAEDRAIVASSDDEVAATRSCTPDDTDRYGQFGQGELSCYRVAVTSRCAPVYRALCPCVCTALCSCV